MIPANYYHNSSASPFPQLDQPIEDHHHQFFNHNFQPAVAANSSSSPSCHIFFSSTQDKSGFYHREMQQHHHQQEADNIVSYGESCDLEEDQRTDGLRISLWKKKDQNETYSENNRVSSKMRLMQKMKKPDQITGGEIPANTTFKFQDMNQRQPPPPPSSPLGTHHNSSSSSFSTNSNIDPIRVCSDCNTTKTPLWRSGPKGPKSLCNACGIRQRKARRAMAAAATNGTIPESEMTTAAIIKNKIQQKEKTRNIMSHAAQYNKRYKTASAAASACDRHVQKKLNFEEFFLNLSKKLAFHQVFPQDEKEAAILLMALSCGLLHG